jgi:hypothetical protein
VPLTERFTGTCELLGPVNSDALKDWIGAIPFEEWPQQHRLADGLVRPAMLTDLKWRGFGIVAGPVVSEIMRAFPACDAYQKMLSVVMPGHAIEPHRDEQSPRWLCRVHVPLTSNDRSQFIVGGVAHVLIPGMAYRVNTLAEHAVVNDGDTPRIHFMFDVSRG